MKKTLLSVAALVLCVGSLSGCCWHPPCGGGSGGGGSTMLSPTQQHVVTNSQPA